MRSSPTLFTLRLFAVRLVLIGFLLAAAPVAFSESKHPAEERGIKSYDENIEALITFANGSGQTIKIYWIDFDGKRVLYMTLQNGEAYTQQTFLTHPWLITDENDNAWSLHYPDGEPRRVEVSAPVKK